MGTYHVQTSTKFGFISYYMTPYFHHNVFSQTMWVLLVVHDQERQD